MLVSNVKNPVLFELLDALCGVKEVLNAGEALTTLTHGEQYRIDCPRCGDQRGRCVVSYLFGVPMPNSNKRIWKIHCWHNENRCWNWEAIQEFWDELITPFGKSTQNRTRRIEIPSSSSFQSPYPRQVPTACRPLTNAAARWLRQAGFNPTRTAKKWGLMTYSASNCLSRLFIPIDAVYQINFQSDPSWQLAGWQLRRLRRNDAGPKYLTAKGTKRGSLLYGLRQVIWPVREFLRNDLLVLCESPKDVWRFHEARIPAVAMMGKSLTAGQRELLNEYWVPHGSRLLMLDSDVAQDEIDKIVSKARNARFPVILRPMPVPNGRKSPADCRPEELWSTLRDEPPDYEY